MYLDNLTIHLEGWKLAWIVIGNITNALWLLSPANTCLDIIKHKSVGLIDSFTFLTIIANACPNIVYGILADDLGFLLANTLCLICGLTFSLIYLYYSSIPWYKASWPLSAFSFSLILLFIIPKKIAINIIGYYMIITISFIYIAPFSVCILILSLKDSSPMPALITLAMWLNCTAWVVYGVTVTADIFIALPNFVGVLCTSVQLILICVYPPVIGAHPDFEGTKVVSGGNPSLQKA